MSSFAVFTRKMKEKVGLAERSEEDPAITEQAKRVTVLQNHLRKLTKNLDKTLQSMGGMVENGAAVSDSLVDFHVMFKDDTDRYLMSGCLERVGEFQRKIEDVRKKLIDKIDADVSTPLKGLVETEIKEAQTQKTLYDGVRVDLANANDKLAAAKKSKKEKEIQKAEQDAEAKKKQFEQVDKETLFKLRDTVDVSEFQTLDRVCTYIEEHRQFFQRGSQFLNEMMTDIYDYRRYVEEKRETLKKQMQARPQSIILSKRSSYLETKSETVSTKLFGVSLQDLVKREGKDVPAFFEAICQKIELIGLDEEGIFRMAGSKNEVVAQKGFVDQGKLDFSNIRDPHVAVDMLKAFLRELPEPLLTYRLYNKYIECTSIDAKERQNQVVAVNSMLPKTNRAVFERLVRLLHRASLRTKQNKMSPVTLSTCVGPNILSTNEQLPDPFEATAQANAIISFIIQNYDEVFPPEHVSPPSSPRKEGGTSVVSSSDASSAPNISPRPVAVPVFALPPQPEPTAPAAPEPHHVVEKDADGIAEDQADHILDD